MTQFQELSYQEMDDVNGGGFLLVAGICCAGLLCLAAGFAIGYGLAMWLG